MTERGYEELFSILGFESGDDTDLRGLLTLSSTNFSLPELGNFGTTP